uniref:Uncharacterized protein n=1 Tax=Anguilla anguilla TaxID=7936 RepID=A0A0E9QTK5_ANGAN
MLFMQRYGKLIITHALFLSNYSDYTGRGKRLIPY